MRREEKCKILFGTVLKYKFAKGITDETLYKRIGMSENTYLSRKKNPEKFTIGEFIEMFDFLGSSEDANRQNSSRATKISGRMKTATALLMYPFGSLSSPKCVGILSGRFFHMMIPNTMGTKQSREVMTTTFLFFMIAFISFLL